MTQVMANSKTIKKKSTWLTQKKGTELNQKRDV